MPIPLIVVGAVLLFFALVCLLRIHVTVTMRDSVTLTVRVLFIRIRIFPRNKRVKPKGYSQKKAAKKAAKNAKRRAKHTPPESEVKKKTTLPEKLRLVRALCAALFRRTHKHLRLHAARLRINVATGDAARTAVLYGAVCQTLAYLLALLDRITHLKATTPDVAVNADFVGEKSSADVRLSLSVRVGGALLILLSVALAYIKAKLDRDRRRKQKEKNAAKAASEKASQKG